MVMERGGDFIEKRLKSSLPRLHPGSWFIGEELIGERATPRNRPPRRRLGVDDPVARKRVGLDERSPSVRAVGVGGHLRRHRHLRAAGRFDTNHAREQGGVMKEIDGTHG